MNLTRDFYKKFVNNMHPDEGAIADVIGAAEDFKKMTETAGWRRVEKFIETSRRGTQQYMTKETGAITLFSLPWLFNTFFKWLGVMLENRAYTRIETYIRVTIARGEQAAAKRVKEAAKEARNES